MIILREYKENDLEDIKDILSKENVIDFNLDGIIYVLLEDNKILGVGKTSLEKDKYFLKYLIIKEEERRNGLGDGLIRAILYKLQNNNIDKLYFKGNNKFLLSKGFKNEIKNEFYLDIDSFFNSGCNCSGACNGV